MPHQTRPEAPRTRLAASLAFCAGLAVAGSARADAEMNLFDLLMAWESASVCGFPMSDEAADQVQAAIEEYGAELGRTQAELDELREQAAWQILRQKREMCAPEGSWRARYDELLAGLADG